MSTDGIPRKPSGQSSEAQFARAVHEKVYREGNLGPVSGHRVMNTTHGKMILPSRASGGSGAAVEMFKLAPLLKSTGGDWDGEEELEEGVDLVPSVYGDFIYVREWDGTTQGTTETKIAKPAPLRESLTSQKIFGDTHGYSYAENEDADKNNRKRTHTVAPDAQTEMVIPPWVAGQIIYAVQCDTGVIHRFAASQAGQPRPAPVASGSESETDTREAVDYLMIGDGRQWAWLEDL